MNGPSKVDGELHEDIAVIKKMQLKTKNAEIII